MKAAVIEAFGPDIPVRVRDVPRPAPGPGQVLVEVRASSVNPIDWKIPGGQMAMRYGSTFPMILGFDASGVVVEAGPDVSTFAPGDPVFARSDVGAGGCYAEYAVLNTRTVAHKPEELSHSEAAAMPLAALTALNGLRDPGHLKAGQRVLIIGASGGVGTYAVQIARNMGARVTAVCTAGNGALARELGAEQVIDYGREQVLVPGANYDVIYDTVGAHNLDVARPALSASGVYITLVPVPGIEFFMPGQTERKAGGGYFLVWAPTAADLRILAGWVREGRLKSVIDSEFRFDEIPAAHTRSKTLRAQGKIVLRVKD
jgi:2-desacetyl-2-hydroxyethyl bacteriochlorophyllide A dehydrogenase